MKGIEAFNSEPGFHFSPPGNFADNSDFSSGLPSHLEKNTRSYNDNDNNSDSFSLGDKNSEHFVSMSGLSDPNAPDSDIISEYSYLPKKKRNI